MAEGILVAGILLAAAAYLGRRAWLSLANIRRAKSDPGCGPGCGCE